MFFTTSVVRFLGGSIHVMIRQLKSIVGNWILPPAIGRLLRNYSPRALFFFFTHLSVFRLNKSLRNLHAGERCFILCNGPSVKEQDIKRLRGEVVFSVSNGYRHPDFHVIQPKYHFVPQITYSALPLEATIDWFNEMHQSIGDANLFLSWQEWKLVKKYKLFNTRKVNYLCMSKREFSRNGQFPELDGVLPSVQSVPVMALMTALYMGFDKIYLIGADHDWFVKNEYKYFFDGQVKGAKDYGVSPKGRVLTTLWDALPSLKSLWGQYRSIKCIAEKQGVNIYNATQGGMLDEFERVDFDFLFLNERR